MAAGAQVVSRGRPHGKGANVDRRRRGGARARRRGRAWSCSATATSATRPPGWRRWSRRSSAGDCDLAVAAFSRRVGGGFGVALGFARWAIRRRCGLETEAPISGQRAMRAEVLRAALPFARGYGMEIGMTIDAVRAGYRLGEYELDLSHRATGRSLAGFATAPASWSTSAAST